MKIELSYRFSKLDNIHEFGIEIIDADNSQTYCRWIYYYLGVYLGENRKYLLFQYSLTGFFKGKVIKTYKYCNDAKRQARLLANAINRKLAKIK